MADVDVTAEAMFGFGDYMVFVGVITFTVYWFVIRKKEEVESPEFKKYNITPMQTDTSLIGKMKKSGKDILMVYGSQTGTADEFARILAKDAAKYGLKPMIADPEDYDMSDLPKLCEIKNAMAVFCLATYGEGDPSDNAQEFYDWLMEYDEDLSTFTYGIFGLGNRTYEHFNKMANDVDKKLQELGAERIYDLGLGDDDKNIEEDFNNWREEFWPAVCDFYSIDSKASDLNLRGYYLKTHEDESIAAVYKGEPFKLGSFETQKPPYDSKNPFLATIVENKETHKKGDRSGIHIEFDLTGSIIRYECGDHIAVYPVNDNEIVTKIGERLNTNLDQVISLVNVDADASKKNPFPCPTTYRTALSHYLDILSKPRTTVLNDLSDYATDESEKEFLAGMSKNTPEGKESYQNWILKDCRHILDILEDCPSVNIPMDHLCEILPRLQPRYYSISSSPKVNPKIVSITAVLVDYTTPTGRVKKGVATNWLKNKSPAKVPVFIRKSQFRLPFKPTVPIIMIGPGTGLAPFRGFVQEKNIQKQNGAPIGDVILYFGCRSKEEDFIYEDELNSYCENKAITRLHTAFSRDQEQKIYVQHLLAQNADETWNILEKGGHIYVCGDAAHMAVDVDKTLVEIIRSKGNMDSNSAQNYIKRLRSRGRYSCDVWS